MCNYHCPFAERKACAGFLLCRDMYEEGVNYNVRANAMNVICAFQKQCMVTGRMENTDTAKECYKMRLEAKQPKVETAPDAPAEPAAEEASVQTAANEDSPKANSRKRTTKKSN